MEIDVSFLFAGFFFNVMIGSKNHLADAVMDDTEVVQQALAGVIDTEIVVKQWEQAFREVRLCTNNISKMKTQIVLCGY